MTADEAVERFSEAYDDALSPEERKEFDALLAGDPALQAEYDEFRELLNATRRIALEEEDEEEPDLLAGVQAKLHRRSRGRYYRDRFAREGHRGSVVFTLVLAMAMAVTVLITWFMLTYVQLEVPADVPPEPSPPTAPQPGQD